MNIREFLVRTSELLPEVVSGGPVSRGLAVYAHLVEAAPKELGHLAPSWSIVGSLGKGYMTATPWVAFLDPDETTKPTEGLYVVYIITPDHDAVTLSLNQGVTAIRNRLGDSQARDYLHEQADWIRDRLDDHLVALWDSGIDLSGVGRTQRLYEAGTLLGRRYVFAELPLAERLTEDLEQLFRLYGNAIEIKRNMLLHEPGRILSPSRAPAADDDEGDLRFQPKPDGSYMVTVPGGKRARRRSHETLVRRFGEACVAKGMTVGTNVHPEDAEVHTGSGHWVAEMKKVKPGKEMQAVREAHAQLEMYVDLLHAADNEPRKLAVFDRPVGDPWVGYLARRGIEAVWHEAGAWHGTPDAVADGLADVAMDAKQFTSARKRPT